MGDEEKVEGEKLKEERALEVRSWELGDWGGETEGLKAQGGSQPSRVSKDECRELVKKEGERVKTLEP
jgi:hypothetical protein